MASNIYLFFNTSRNKRTFPEVLAEIQEYLASKYSTLITDNPEEQHQQITAYIAKYLNDYSLGVEGMSHEELIDKLYTEMAEFSFLTPYLFANDVEEININSWKDVKITYADGRVVPTKDRFQTPQHAVDVIRRLLHKSGMILDNSQPGVVGHLSNKIRITVLGNPLTDKEKGVAASIRIVNPKKLSRDDFISYGTATAEMLDFLTEVLRFGLSICVTGSTGSGKTTLMSWILSTIPNEKRIFTIENGCREFDLVKEDAEGNVINNVVHTVTRFSDDPKQNYDQERLLEFALTCNPDIVCVGEMKSAEAFAAQEAARTGHAVITTTHANSCKATYYRMVTLCTQKYDMGDKTLYNLVTEAFPIVLFVKKLEDNSRRVMEITECEILEDGTRQLHTLYRYHVSETSIQDGKVKVHGEFQKVSTISASLQKRLLENGMPPRLLERIAGGGELKLCKRAYIARDELIDLNGLFAAHNEYVAALLGLFIIGIVKRGGSIEHAGMYLYYGILAELVHNGLYDLTCELAVIGHADGVAVRIGSGGGLNLGSGGHIMHQIVQQRGNANVGRGGAAAHGGDYAFLNAVAQACEYFFAAELAFFEELLHQCFVGFGGGLGQRFVNALRLGFHVGGDGYFLFALAVEFLGSHVGNVNVTHELAAFHYGQLYGNHAGAELFVYLGHGLGEVGVFAIHLVHDHHAGLIGLFAHVHGLFNAYHGAGYGAHDYKGGIRQGHCGADFAIEIEEAGGIDNVDLGVLPLKGSEGGVDGNGTLDLLRIVIANGVAVAGLAHAVDGAGHIKQTLCQSGLAASAVAQQTDIANVLNRIPHNLFPLLILGSRAARPDHPGHLNLADYPGAPRPVSNYISKPCF